MSYIFNNVDFITSFYPQFWLWLPPESQYADDMGSTKPAKKPVVKTAPAAQKKRLKKISPKNSSSALPAGLVRHVRINKLKRMVLLYGSLVVLTATGASAIHAARASRLQADPFPASQRQAVQIQLYYPDRLPKGYQFDTASAESVETKVVVLRITNPASGQYVSFSQQPAPQNFNFQVLHNSFEGKTSFKVTLGTVTTGTIDNGKTRIASLVTHDKTWILANASPAVTTDELKTAFGSLQPSR